MISLKTGPDFIIGGAPKCGTTSLHFILDQHPKIALPINEVNYFDADDPLQWPDFFSVKNNDLILKDPSLHNKDTKKWYETLYSSLPATAILGEDSTRYLFSPVAPHRISERLPGVKLIFMLRDPVQRAYSQYWHEMSMMRATRSFEYSLMTMPQIINCSTYSPHLKTWIEYFGRDRVHILLFEDFQKDSQKAINSVAQFLEIPEFDISSYNLWFNKSSYPLSLTAQKMLNRIGQFIAPLKYRPHMATSPQTRMDYLANKLYQNWFHRINPILLRSRQRPEMRAQTRNFLTQLLYERNAGLEDILERDLSTLWPTWRAQKSLP